MAQHAATTDQFLALYGRTRRAYRAGLLTFHEAVNGDLPDAVATGAGRDAAFDVTRQLYRDAVRATRYVPHTAEGLTRPGGDVTTKRHGVTPYGDAVCGRRIAAITKADATVSAVAPNPLVSCTDCIEQLCDAFDPADEADDDPVECGYCGDPQRLCACDEALRRAELLDGADRT